MSSLRHVMRMRMGGRRHGAARFFCDASKSDLRRMAAVRYSLHIFFVLLLYLPRSCCNKKYRVAAHHIFRQPDAIQCLICHMKHRTSFEPVPQYYHLRCSSSLKMIHRLKEELAWAAYGFKLSFVLRAIEPLQIDVKERIILEVSG